MVQNSSDWRSTNALGLICRYSIILKMCRAKWDRPKSSPALIFSTPSRHDRQRGDVLLAMRQIPGVQRPWRGGLAGGEFRWAQPCRPPLRCPSRTGRVAPTCLGGRLGYNEESIAANHSTPADKAAFEIPATLTLSPYPSPSRHPLRLILCSEKGNLAGAGYSHSFSAFVAVLSFVALNIRQQTCLPKCGISISYQ